MTELNQIYNFIQIDDNLATAGQPSAAQFEAIAQAGYDLIINLAPSDVSHALPNEKEIVSAQGMGYVQIPVVWQSPQLDEWNAFVETMQANQDKKIFVHCIANMRVSAFVMLYRHIKLGVSLEDAQASMFKIWNPEERHPYWQEFIEDIMKQ